MDTTPEFSATPYAALLWRRKWLIAGTFVVTLLVVALGTTLLTPTYQATATLRVLTAARGSVDWVDYDIAYTERLMNTYARLATSEPVLQEVRQRLTATTYSYPRRVPEKAWSRRSETVRRQIR